MLEDTTPGCLIQHRSIAVAILRDREDEAEPNFQNGNPSKINQESGMFFEPENRPSTHQLSPAIHHNLTTKKPRPTARFRQNPQQKQGPTTPKKITAEAPLFEQGFGFFGAMAAAATLS